MVKLFFFKASRSPILKKKKKKKKEFIYISQSEINSNLTLL